MNKESTLLEVRAIIGKIFGANTALKIDSNRGLAKVRIFRNGYVISSAEHADVTVAIEAAIDKVKIHYN